MRSQLCGGTTATLHALGVPTRSTIGWAHKSGGSARSAVANSLVKQGTIFEDSSLSLDKWLTALWLIVNCENGISSHEVAKDLV